MTLLKDTKIMMAFHINV